MKYVIATLILMTSLMTNAAPGVVATTTVKLFMRYYEPGANVIAEALENYPNKKSETVTVSYHNFETGEIYPQAPIQLTVVFFPRDEPEAPVATNFIILDDDIFKVEGLDISSIEKVGVDLLKLSGSAGYGRNDQDNSCGRFSGIHRELVIKFGRDSKHGLNATVVNQRDTAWCR